MAFPVRWRRNDVGPLTAKTGSNMTISLFFSCNIIDAVKCVDVAVGVGKKKVGARLFDQGAGMLSRTFE